MAPISKRNVLWPALFLGLILSSSAWADPVLKDVSCPLDNIYEGQKVAFKLTFEWPAEEGEYEIKVPQDIGLKNIKLIDLSRSQETHSSDSGPVSRFVLIYQIMPLKKGQGTISGLNILSRKSGTLTWQTISVPTIIVNIKAALPIKKILILVTIPLAIVFPFALWFIRGSWAERKHEKSFQSDPKQQFYANAMGTFISFTSGYNASSLQALLSEWSTELMNVAMTCYDIPIRPTTKSEILKELGTKDIPANELHEIEGLFDSLEHLRFSTETALTSQKLEKLRLSLLRYVKGKIITGP